MSVEGYIGLPGSGKTYSMVHRAYYRRRKNPALRVWANFHISLPGGPVELLRKLPEDLRNVRDGLVLLDELNIVMPGRLWNKVPAEMMYKFNQTRKSRLDLYYSAQVFDMVDKAAREVTNETWEMSNWANLGFFWYRRYILGNHKYPNGRGLIMFEDAVIRSYDTMEFIDVPEYAIGKPGDS